MSQSNARRAIDEGSMGEKMKTTINCDELDTLESDSRALGTSSQECVVAGWESHPFDGNYWVRIGGEYVFGGADDRRVLVRTQYESSCQHCKNERVSNPLVLWARFEHALDRLMFWFGPDPAWETAKRYCDKCAASRIAQSK